MENIVLRLILHHYIEHVSKSFISCGSSDRNMQVCKYAGMQHLYITMQVCKYALMQVCMYANMKVCKYASIQVYKYACMLQKVKVKMWFAHKVVMSSFCKPSIKSTGHFLNLASNKKKYFAKIDGNAQKPVKWPNWSISSPLMAILDFAVGSTVNESTHRC